MIKEGRFEVISGPFKAPVTGNKFHYKCDLCDESNYPIITWACFHDDPFIKTFVCTDCLAMFSDVDII